MSKHLPNCWEIKHCGIESECPAALEGMGHSCWAVAGSLNESRPFCREVRDRDGICSMCVVFQKYRRSSEQIADEIERQFPEEHARYMKLMAGRWKANRDRPES